MTKPIFQKRKDPLWNYCDTHSHRPFLIPQGLPQRSPTRAQLTGPRRSADTALDSSPLFPQPQRQTFPSLHLNYWRLPLLPPQWEFPHLIPGVWRSHCLALYWEEVAVVEAYDRYWCYMDGALLDSDRMSSILQLMRRLTIEYRLDCPFWLFIEWIVFKNSTPFQDEIAYLCWMSGQPIERKAHRSRSCTPATVSKIGQEEGTWKCNMHSPVEKIQKQHLFELQVLQQTTPHFLQWWRRFTNVNWTWKIVWLWYTRMITCHIHNVYWYQDISVSLLIDGKKRWMNERPFCSAYMCPLHYPAPTLPRDRPQPSFQTCAKDPAQRSWGEFDVQRLLRQTTSMHLLMWAIHSCFSVAVAAKTAKDLPLNIHWFRSRQTMLLYK